MTAATAQVPVATAPSPKVMLVEDDEVTQTLLRRFLERSGFHVTVADNGWDAFELALAAPPQLILLDLMMPKLDGFGFLEALRSSTSAHVPVIVTSALADAARKDRATTLGVKEYLVKTKFTLADLLTAVKRHLDATPA